LKPSQKRSVSLIETLAEIFQVDKLQNEANQAAPKAANSTQEVSAQ